MSQVSLFHCSRDSRHVFAYLKKQSVILGLMVPIDVSLIKLPSLIVDDHCLKN